MILPAATYISEKYTYENYLKLNFKLDSTEEIWEEAINMFEDRINSRIIYGIDKLITNKNTNKREHKHEMLKYGFPIMILQCSLIDTFAKFRYGSSNQSKRFIDFLMEYFLFDFKGEEKEKIAKKFYKDIRCGIVHSGSTENMSGLSCDSLNLINIMKEKDKEFISVDIFIMDKKLREYFDQYKKKLKDKEQYELRKNFVKIMNVVCKI